MSFLGWLKRAGIILSISFIIIVAVEHLIPGLFRAAEYRAKQEIVRQGESILISHLSPDVEPQFISNLDLFAFHLSQGGNVQHIRDHIAILITECHVPCGWFRSFDGSNISVKWKFDLRHMDDSVDVIGRRFAAEPNVDRNFWRFVPDQIRQGTKDGIQIGAQLPLLSINRSEPLLSGVPSGEAGRYSGRYDKDEDRVFEPVFAFGLGAALTTLGGWCYFTARHKPVFLIFGVVTLIGGWLAIVFADIVQSALAHFALATARILMAANSSSGIGV
jgi:hypothetical protein